MNDSRSFIMLYKALFAEPYADMPLEDKIAYSILQDRYRLSQDNKFCDDTGKICVVYPAAELGVMLGCSRQKVGRIMDRLVERGMIGRRMSAKGMPYYIYVLPLSHGVTPPIHDNHYGDVIQNDINNTDNSKTEYSDIDHEQYDINDVCIGLMARWNYRYLCTLGNEIADKTGLIIDVAASIMCMTTETIYIASEIRKLTHVQATIMRLTAVHIEHIAKRIIDVQDNINDMYGYIATALYNSGMNAPG